MLLELLMLVCLLILLYKQWTNAYNYWKDRGFPFIEGKFPFGSGANNVLISDYYGEIYQKIYNDLAPHPIGGFYIATTPSLVVRDLDLIKHILVKDFNHFRDRNDFPAKNLLTKNLFHVGGYLWRMLRLKLTPTFTSGKIKQMFGLFLECSKRLDQQFQELCDKGEQVDIKDWMARFTLDIICSCAFGLDGNAIDKPDNELRMFASTFLEPTISTRVKVIRFLTNTFPVLKRLFRFRIIPEQFEKTMYKIIKDAIDHREKNNISRNDFLQMLINMKNDDISLVENNSNKIKMDLALIAAQCYIFFLAGFETSSSVQTYCLNELLMNEDVQTKLQTEIDEVLKRHNGDITYEAIKEMSYLEQVINETMRKYPTISTLTRICQQTYKIPETDLIIEKGMKVYIPVFAIQRDPKYFPEPEKFIPERFSSENKSSIPQFAFLPFGEGPRMCIGMRFGLLQTKLGIATILSKYNLKRSPNTVENLTFAPTYEITRVNEKIVMKIERRIK